MFLQVEHMQEVLFKMHNIFFLYSFDLISALNVLFKQSAFFKSVYSN